MSTPTAAGITAPSVGMTVPTALPFPAWASGMRATCGVMNGNAARARACSRVVSSMMLAQLRTLGASCVGMVSPYLKPG